MERNSIRPTLDVNGIWEDIRERAPKQSSLQAYAKISMRLVHIRSEEITQMFTDHFQVHRTEFGANKGDSTPWRRTLCLTD